MHTLWEVGRRAGWGDVRRPEDRGSASGRRRRSSRRATCTRPRPCACILDTAREAGGPRRSEWGEASRVRNALAPNVRRSVRTVRPKEICAQHGFPLPTDIPKTIAMGCERSIPPVTRGDTASKPAWER